MSINLNSLSAKELEALINQAKKRRMLLAKRKPIVQVRKKLTQLARAEGYSIEELFGAPAGRGNGRGAKSSGKSARAARKGNGGKVPPKYRNPDNPAETWTGRGKQPRWMAALVAQGRKPEDFLIK